MSSLLDRMVQRTRVPRSGVEPLLRPRYSPQPRTVDPQSSKMGLADSILEVSRFPSAESGSVTAHSEALPAPQTPNPNPRRPSEPAAPASPDRMRPRERAPATRVDPPGYASRSPAAESLPVTQVDERRFGSGNPQPNALPATPIAHRSSSSPNLATESLAQPVQAGAGTVEAAPQRLSARLTPAMNAVSPVGSTPHSVASKKPANEQTFPSAPTTAGPGTLLRSQEGFPSSRQPQLAPHIGAKFEEIGTNVTISIGHIEVRAAPEAERPCRPRFRPRVSLNDFLNQKNGGQV
jgi:hypothetical protein